MKDLKHMIYFEKLLDSACNDLVREAQKENRVAVGYTCFHIPEVVLRKYGTAGDPGEREKEFLYQLCGCAGKR